MFFHSAFYHHLCPLYRATNKYLKDCSVAILIFVNLVLVCHVEKPAALLDAKFVGISACDLAAWGPGFDMMGGGWGRMNVKDS